MPKAPFYTKLFIHLHYVRIQRVRRKWQPPEMRQPYKSKVNPSPFREVDLPLRRKRPVRQRRHWGYHDGLRADKGPTFSHCSVRLFS